MNKFILPTILILASIGLFIVYIDPTYKDAQDINAVKQQYDDALAKSKELRTVRDALLQKYNSFSDVSLARIKKMVPDNVDNVRLIMDVDSIASKYGSTIRDVKVSVSDDSQTSGRVNIAENKEYDSVNLDFSINTTYDNFYNFITDLKDSLRLVDVTGLSFDYSRQNPGFYKFSFSIRTYRLK